MLTWIGIDISCKQFDAAWYTETGRKHIKLDNNDEGFVKLLEEVPEEAAFVMEATGSYSIPARSSPPPISADSEKPHDATVHFNFYTHRLDTTSRQCRS